MAKRFQVPVDHVIKVATNINGGTLAVDRANGEYQVFNLTASVTVITLTGWPVADEYGKIILEINNTGAFGLIGWPAAVKWSGGLIPTLTPSSGKDLLLVLTSRDGGTTIRGSIAGQDFV